MVLISLLRWLKFDRQLRDFLDQGLKQPLKLGSLCRDAEG